MPVKEREIIRAAGPTVHPHTGKQAGQCNAQCPGQPSNPTCTAMTNSTPSSSAERVEQFAGQVARRLSGELTEDQFKPLRLMNGLYLQLHAYMLRIAVPYGTLSSRQMRKLAHIARTYDKGFGHFTTRTNLQFNWIKLVDVPDILRELASVEMHCIQTSGNCIRNVTADQFAGATAEEIEDPRPLAEIIRQWSSLHPEFVFLAAQVQDRGGRQPNTTAPRCNITTWRWRSSRNAEGRIGYKVMAGGGMGRTPYIAHVMSEFVEREDILAYLEAVLRVYNQDSRRDNIHKQRIKILINAIGAGGNAPPRRARVRRDQAHAAPCNCRRKNWTASPPISRRRRSRPACPTPCPKPATDFANWVKTNVHKHTRAGLCHRHHLAEDAIGQVPGDATADQMDAIADLMDAIQPGRSPRHP